MENETRKYDFDRVTRLIITIVSVIIFVWVLNYLSGVLLPFLIGCLIAYMLEPLVKFFLRKLHLKKRIIPVLITLLIFFSVIIGFFWLVIPYLTEEFSNMGRLLAKYAKTSIEIPYIPASVDEYIKQHIDLSNFTNWLSQEQWVKVINKIAQGTWTIVGGTMSIILTIASSIIILLYMFFVMLDYDKITRSFKAAIPPKYRRNALRLFGDVESTMSRYFRGQALVSFFVGIIFAIEFYIIGLPLAIVFGLFIGVLNLVPYLQLTSIPIAAFLCLVASVASGGSFWVLFGWTIAAYCICQIIQDLILIPAIMKQQMGLNPAIIFLSLSIWGYVLGFIGLIIALPLTTLIISYYTRYVLKK